MRRSVLILEAQRKNLSKTTYWSGELLEQILFGLVDFVAFGGDAERNLLVQPLNVVHIGVGHLLEHLDKMRKLGPKQFVDLDAQRNECGLDMNTEIINISGIPRLKKNLLPDSSHVGRASAVPAKWQSTHWKLSSD